MLSDHGFKRAKGIITERETWSDDTIEALVDRHLMSQSLRPTLSVPPIQNIALVGAVTSTDGKLMVRDRDYVEAFFAELIAAGLPIDPDISVTNYNLNNGTDIFDRNAPADALLVCNINTTPSKHDSDTAPIYTGESDVEDHFFHISSKSTAPKAWADLAQKLKVKVAAVYGWGRAVSIAHFSRGQVGFCSLIPYEDMHGQRQFQRWKQETGGEWKVFKKLKQKELDEWEKHSPSHRKPANPQGSDMAVCKSSVTLDQHFFRPHLLGQDGKLMFAVSREFLDLASDPQRNSTALLKMLESKSVLVDTVTEYAHFRHSRLGLIMSQLALANVPK